MQHVNRKPFQLSILSTTCHHLFSFLSIWQRFWIHGMEVVDSWMKEKGSREDIMRMPLTWSPPPSSAVRKSVGDFYRAAPSDATSAQPSSLHSSSRPLQMDDTRSVHSFKISIRFSPTVPLKSKYFTFMSYFRCHYRCQICDLRDSDDRDIL